MAVLSLLSLFFLAWYEAGGVGPFTATHIIYADLVVVVILALDLRREYLQQPKGTPFFRKRWPDILGLVPILVPVAGFLRLFRFFRLFRLLRFLRVMHRTIQMLRSLGHSGQLGQLAAISALITLMGSILVWLVEKPENPSLASYSEALWWAIVTVTTVGYGDITPITPLGRILAGLLMVTGIGTIGLLASQVSSALMRLDREEDVQSGANSTVDHLERLHHLWEAGFLQEEEVDMLKERVLGRKEEEA